MIRIVESEFISSAVKPSQYPPGKYAEMAFVGKSNVGKSSLINMLLNRKKLAKVSRQPGKTRLVNFFQVRFKNGENDGYFSVVDLPGYGFAKVRLQEKESWKQMVSLYFEKRIELRAIFVLVDIRHKADPKDQALISLLKQMGLHFAVIATKSDKIPKSKINASVNKLSRDLELNGIDIMPVSSLKKTGQARLLSWIENLIL